MSDGRCQLCKNPTRYGAVLCWPHTDAVARMLDPRNTGDPTRDIPASIPVMFDMLDPTPGGGGGSDRRAPGFASTPAATLHKLVMRDDRSVNDPQVWYPAGPNGKPDKSRPHTEDDTPPRAIRKAILSLADAIAERWDLPYRALTQSRWANPALDTAGRYTTTPSLTAACGWLHSHLDALTGLDDIGEIFADLLELTNQLRPAIGDRKEGPIGPCVVLIRDRHSRELRECGAQLHLPPPTRDRAGETTEEQRLRKLILTCPRCYEPYRWIDLVRLRYINEFDAAATA